MAEFTYKDLKIARESRKMPRWKLGLEIGVSEDTIERWEKGEKKPDPDDVDNIERALEMEADGLWHDWMFSNYDSYRRRHTNVPRNNSLTETIVRMEHEISDVLAFAKEVERDTLDGRIDNPETQERLKKEILEGIAAMQQTYDKISK